MSRAPIEMMLDKLTWVPVESGPALTGDDGSLAHVTHKGVLELMGHSMRCYRLSDGNTVFDAEDFEALMNDWFSEGHQQGDENA